MPLLFDAFGITQVKDTNLYIKALTHTSYRTSKYTTSSNERLEFLGDAVLEIMVSTYLYHRFPEAEEGKLTRLRSAIVCRENLNNLAQYIHLERYFLTALRISQRNSNILGNAYEALIGAIYLDQGFDYLYKVFTERVLESGFIHWDELQGELYDYRTLILHWSQREHKEVIFRYEEFQQKPPLFECRLLVEDLERAHATGCNKKQAVQKACKLFLKELERENTYSAAELHTIPT